MKVTKSFVEKLRIEDAAPYLSAINVFFEDHGKGRGKVTIECDGDAWSYFWGATARDTIKEFFAEAGTDYLVCKLSMGISRMIDDDNQDAIQEKARKHILSERKEGCSSKVEAELKWQAVDEICGDGYSGDEEPLYCIYGDEWYLRYPQIPNPKYNHLLKIVESIKAAIQI